MTQFSPTVAAATSIETEGAGKMDEKSAEAKSGIQSRFLDHYLSDVIDRTKYQHEFALSTFRTLILVNGGAIVAMLTYAGNVMTANQASGLKVAFLAYAAGLVCTILANIAAYLSQGEAMFYAWSRVQLLVKKTDEGGPDGASANLLIWSAILLTIGGLTGFVWGSWAAVSSLSDPVASEVHTAAPRPAPSS